MSGMRSRSSQPGRHVSTCGAFNLNAVAFSDTSRIMSRNTGRSFPDLEKSRIMSKSIGQQSLRDAPLHEQREADAKAMLDRALAFHRAGAIADAQALYRQILQLFPHHVALLQLLGVSESQTGRHAEADRLLTQALVVEPRSAALHSDRGVVLRELRRFEEALASCDQALALD